MTVAGSVAQLRTNIAAISEIKRTYKRPPESVNEGPAAIVTTLEGEGSIATAGSLLAEDTTLRVIVLYPRKNLAEAIDALEPLIPLIEAAIYGDANLGGECEQVTSYRWEGPGVVPYGALEYVGLIFDVAIHLKENVTVTFS